MNKTMARLLGIVAAVFIVFFLWNSGAFGQGSSLFSGVGRGSSYGGSCTADDPMCFMGAGASHARWAAFDAADFANASALRRAGEAVDVEIFKAKTAAALKWQGIENARIQAMQQLRNGR